MLNNLISPGPIPRGLPRKLFGFGSRYPVACCGVVHENFNKWNEIRDDVNKILNTTTRLLEIINIDALYFDESNPGDINKEETSRISGVLSHINASHAFLDASSNPLSLGALLFPGCHGIKFLSDLQRASKKAIELFGGDHQSRPKSIGIKVRIVCYIAHLYYEHYVVGDASGESSKLSYYENNIFHKLIKSVFLEGTNVVHSIRQARKRHGEYLDGDKTWWLNNIDRISGNSASFKKALEFGIVPDIGQAPVLDCTSADRRLKLQKD